MDNEPFTFLDMHQQGTFLLVNAHSAGAAVLAQAAGAAAVGTTSSGHAYTLARRDGVVSKRDSIQRAAEICAAVKIPVSVDAENGWGHSPEEVAATIVELADIGAAGASIEDWSGDPGIGIYERGLAVERVQAAVETAQSLPEPFVISARADAFLYHRSGDPLGEAIDRLQGFAAAGAQCVYAPGTNDVAHLAKIVQECPAPVNALISVGSELTMSRAEELGIRRVSVGGSLYRATMATFQQLVSQILESGSFRSEVTPLGISAIEDLFAQL